MQKPSTVIRAEIGTPPVNSDPIQTLLPVGAVAVSSCGQGASDLLPGEARLMARARAARRREFAAGRACAHRALALLGRPDVAVLAGPHREPLWPPGILGSITHCPGCCAAVVAPAGRLLGLGIDAERNVPMDPTLRRRVTRPVELTAAERSVAERSAGAAAQPVADAAVLIFSAKEAFYKAWFPLTRIELDFGDVSVGLNPGDATFEVRLLTPTATTARPDHCTLHGRWAATASHLYTVATISGPDSPAVGR